MNIIVCVKQVPNLTNVQIDQETGRLKRDGVESIINSFDEHALEEGIRIKEKIGGKVIVVTMGPKQAEIILRDALAKGADEAFLISDKIFIGSDTLATSYVLSSAIKFIGDYDIIICGKQASDGDTAQVGPGISEMLNIPHISYVKKIEFSNDKLSIIAERIMENGYDLIKSYLPVLMTVVKEINIPRISSLRGRIFANKAIIKTLDAESMHIDIKKAGTNGSPTRVIKTFAVPQKRRGEKISGNAKEISAILVKKLFNLGVIQ
ncbi:MAG: electron transfer flavoprotein subunit beta/FixA family protein [Endomicrobium sp.]|jgi:electron transfer flavoprotein beta subunit|nr:electron transfer flavoprotein subunit beta/FixA family protein [Endomicrobium sp.]